MLSKFYKIKDLLAEPIGKLSKENLLRIMRVLRCDETPLELEDIEEYKMKIYLLSVCEYIIESAQDLKYLNNGEEVKEIKELYRNLEDLKLLIDDKIDDYWKNNND